MKKSLFILAIVAVASSAFAQPDMMSKRGESILPETGDWALGINADPFVSFAGNLLNGTSNNSNPYFSSPVWDMGSHVIIYGKYVKDPGTHYRGSIRIGFGSDKIELQVKQDSTDGTPFQVTQLGTDEYKQGQNGITVAVGIEKRKGKGRVQGYYGGEFCLGFGGMKETFSYANGITMDNQMPHISSDWGSYGTPDYGDIWTSNGRVTEINHGSMFMVGLRGLLGVEYFFAPHISIGAEFSWGLNMTNWGALETTAEAWGGPNGDQGDALISTSSESPGKASHFGVDTDVDGWSSMSKYASLRMIFYFGDAATAN